MLKTIIQRIDLLIFALFFLLMMQMSTSRMIQYLSFGLLIIWCILVSIKNYNKHRSTVSKQMIVLFIFLICNFFRVYIVHMSLKTVLGSTLNILVLFSGFFIYDYYNKRLSKKEKKIVVLVILTVWLCYSIRAIMFYRIHPGAARAIVSHSADYTTDGLSDPYAIAYGSVLIEIVLFGILINGRKSLKRLEVLGLLVYVVVLTILIWTTESTVTMLAMVCGIFVVLIGSAQGQTKKNKTIIKSLCLVGVLIVVVLFLIYREAIGWWLVNNFAEQSGVFAYKFMLIGQSMIKKSAQGGLGARMDLYALSGRLFCSHPFLGVEVLNIRVGGHSEFLDALAKYGVILGAIPYYGLFYYSLKLIKGVTESGTYSAILVAFLLMVCLNPFHSNLSNFALMFIVPLIGATWNEREDIYNRKRKIME